VAAGGTKQPFFTYALMAVLGAVPTALVMHYYGVLPQRLVLQWDTFGNITVIGTRPGTVLTVAHVAGLVALTGILVSAFQNRTLVELGLRRAFLALNLAQIVAINLVCAMLVNDALGLRLKIKAMIPPAMAVLLFAAGVLFWRMQGGPARAAGGVLMAGGLLMLVSCAIAADAAVGYFASALAVLAMAAIALPQRR
jgi:hypothetical protein